jgi:hypothetical protein
VDGSGVLLYGKQMDMRTSLIVAAMLAAICVFCGWRGARPPNPMRGPRLTPWRFVMTLTAAGGLVALSHAAHLLAQPPV